MYKRRAGTSGIQGHFYESKLLSLILLRAEHDVDIKQFYLASNMDAIGEFDDIVLKAKLLDQERPLFAFIQAKHKERNTGTDRETNEILNINSNILLKYFKSYLAIRQKFYTDDKDEFFNENFDDIECFFIIYTNAGGGNKLKIFNKPSIKTLNRIISTGNVSFQHKFSDHDVQFLSIHYHATELAEHFAKFLYNKYNDTLMSDNFISSYHVLLAQYVVHVSQIKNDHRTCMFRESFFNTTNEFLTKFRSALYLNIFKLKPQQSTDHNLLEAYLNQFVTEPSVAALRHVLGSVIAYNNGKFVLVISMPLELQGKLEKIILPPCSVNDAIELNAIDILKSTEFRIPTAFGNTDIKLIGNLKKIDKRLDYLTVGIVSLMNKAKDNNNVIIIDESIDDGFLRLNGGLGSAFGNLIIYDHTTKVIKFTNDVNLLKNNARKLLDKLTKEIDDISSFTFDVKHKNIPKLSFDCVDENLATDFLNRLVFYTHQGDQNYVEWTCKQYIFNRQISRFDQIPDQFNIHLTSDAIFRNYHDQIQSWWMLSQDGTANYLTKSCKMYEKAKMNILKHPLIDIMHVMYLNVQECIERHVKFEDSIIQSFKSQIILSVTIVSTNEMKITVSKVMQCLKFPDYVVLDTSYISKALERTDRSEQELVEELKDIDQEDTIVIIFEDEQYYEKLKLISAALNTEKLIIITKLSHVEKVRECFPCISKHIHDITHSLLDLQEESRKYILKKAPVILQDIKLSLDLIVDEELAGFTNGAILSKMICGQTINLHLSLNKEHYDSIKYLYVNRRVKLEEEEMTIELKTLLDIKNDVVVITAEPGMGKSTLLTHLSLETLKLNSNHSIHWVVRINVSEHYEIFSEWQNNNTEVNISETLSFICNIIFFKKVDLLKFPDDADEWNKYRKNLFMWFFNKGKVKFLFDGFDEICPHYTDIVLKLLNVLKNDFRKNKIWIASRNYREIQDILQQNFGSPYRLQKFSTFELDRFLDTFWKRNVFVHADNMEKIFALLYKTSAGNVITNATLSLPLGRAHVSFLAYLLNKLTYTVSVSKWPHLYRTINFIRDASNPEPGSSTSSTPIVYHEQDVDSPLLTYLSANYFANCLKKTRNSSLCHETVHTALDAVDVYQDFIENILKVYFKHKNKIDIYNPIVIPEYRVALEKSKNKYKAIAAFVIFHQERKNIFDETELEEVKKVINDIRIGVEKTGLICSVSNNIPQFVHKTFAEFLGVQFLLDKMIPMDNERRQILANVLSNQIHTEWISGYCVWIHELLAKDEYNKLSGFFADIKNIVIPLPAI